MPTKNAQYVNAYQKRKREENANIGQPPEVEDPARKESCQYDLKLFCETYRPNAFVLGWSEDHVKVLNVCQEVVTGSGLFAVAMPRGSGKTTIAITTALWALLYGHRRWVCLIGATSTKAVALLKSIKSELRFNPLLMEDFPEVCHPIRHLEGRGTRAAMQTIDGISTDIEWSSDSLVFPTVEGSESSGATLSVCGITGDIRGQQRTTSKGEIIRPDFVIPDDPQTRESAFSPQQVNTRLDTLAGDVLGLAGPGVKIAGIMPCTVVARYDVADQILNGDRGADWRSIRSRMLYGEPENPDLWEEYRIVRETELKNDGDGTAARMFYEENREKLDAGLRAAWEDRKSPGDVSAIRHAMELHFRDPVAFSAEYQNEPPAESTGDILEKADLESKINNIKPAVVPNDATKLVAMIDVQKDALYWVVMATSQNFHASVIQYGTWPDQGNLDLKYNNLRFSLSAKYGSPNLESYLPKAIDDLTKYIFGAGYRDIEGTPHTVSRIMIDANWGLSRNVIYNWISHRNDDRILPSHGRGVTATSKPLNHSAKGGRWVGTHWRIERAKDMPVKFVLFDANFWKSFAAARIRADIGTPGSLEFYSETGKHHNNLFENVLAEYPVPVQSRERSIEEWKVRPGRPDNHYFDCLVGCCVAASIEGVVLGQSIKKTAGRKRGTTRQRSTLL